MCGHPSEGLKLRRAWREACHALLSGGLRAYAMVFAIGIALLAPGVADARYVHQVAVQEEALLLAGATAMIVAGDELVNVDACEKLAESRAVLASGSVAMNVATMVRSSASPLSAPVASVSPGLLEVLHSLRLTSFATGGASEEAPGAVAYSTDELAAQLGLAPGVSRYELHSGGSSSPTTVVALIQLSKILPASAGSAAVVHEPSREAADVCVILAKPGRVAAAEALAGVVAPNAAAVDRVPRPVLYESQFTFNPVSTVIERPTRHLWVFGGIAAGAIWCVSLGFRRSEVGLYLSLGVRRVDVSLIRGLEGLVTIAAGFLVCVPVLIALSLAAPTVGVYMTAVMGPEVVASSGLAAIIGGVLGGLTAAIGDASAMVKDR